MKENDVIKKIEILVEKVCADENNIFGYGIWSHHIMQVVRIGKELAARFNADSKIVEIAALLHDYAGIKDHKLHKEHHVHGATEAEKILKKLNYPQQKIELIKHCIANHRGSVPGKRGTLEAECLANADAIAHIENISSLYYVVYNKFDMQIDEGKEWIQKKLKRSWNKINPDLRYLIEDKYNAALKTLATNVSDKI